MSAFTEEFKPSEVLGTKAANGIDDYIAPGTRFAINERLALEHNDLASAETGADDPDLAVAQGRHKPGYVGVLFYGLYSDLILIPATGGQIGYATDTASFYHYISGSGWTALSWNASDIVADNITLQIIAGSPSKLEMKHDNQQWTTTVELTAVGTDVDTDCDLSNSFEIELGVNGVLNNPTNMKDGATYVWIITQDAGSPRTLSYGTKFKFPGGVAPVLTIGSGGVDIISGIYNATADSIFCGINYDVR